MRTSLFFICLLGVFLCSCGDDIHKGYRAPGYDELGCEIYDIPKREEGKAFLDYELGDDQKEGTGSFKLIYNFTGNSTADAPECVYFGQRWGDYRVDLSFYPLGLSIWVKGKKGN